MFESSRVNYSLENHYLAALKLRMVFRTKTTEIRLYFFIVFVLLYTLMACSTEKICNDDIATSLGAGFYTLDGNVEKDTTARVATVYALNGGDSILYSSSSEKHMVSFILDNNHDTCAVRMKFKFIDTINIDSTPVIDTSWIDDEIDDIDTSYTYDYETETWYDSDTLSFTYERELKMESVECGFVHTFYLENIGWTENVINYVEIVRPAVITTNNENIKIFY